MHAYGRNPAMMKAPGHGGHAYRYTIRSLPMNNNIEKIQDQTYRLENELGRGSYGAVYSARRIPDNKPVAIKITSLATFNRVEAMSYAEGMLSEVQMAKRLQSKSRHIIHMFGFDFDGERGIGFIAMERGLHDFEKELRKQPPSSAQRKAYWRQLVDMAVTLHNSNIVHLDIKPQNIVVFPGHQLKLIDLGIARKKNTRLTGPAGTYGYTAPEVVNLPPFQSVYATTTADVWSWGALLYRMVYFMPPDYQRTPYYRPPNGMPSTKDPLLADVLRHTMTPIQNRVPPPWLATHSYTRTN